jgi:hypothetical protein
VLAVDARNFSALTSREMGEVNVEIREVLARALASIDLEADWREHEFGQHTGDGYVGGLEPRVLPGLVGSFPEALSLALQGRTFQLRVSVHVGPLAGTGIGDPMVHTHRLLDDELLRRLLNRADPKVTNTAVIISDRVYEDVFRSGVTTGRTGAGEYVKRIAKVKTFERPAWVHVPGLDWSLVDPELLEEPPKIEGEAAPPAPPTPPAPNFSFTQNGNGSGPNIQGYQITADLRGGRND